MTLSNNGAGILVKAPNGTGTAKFMLTDSQVTLNADQGLIVNGTPSSANARIGNTTISNNGTGVLVLGTAQVLSYGDTSDGAFSATIARH